MKNKLSRFAVPYEVWMAIFVVAPILIMVIYAFSSSGWYSASLISSYSSE